MGVLGGIVGFVVGFIIFPFVLGAVLPNDWHIKAREHPRIRQWVFLFTLFGCFFFSYFGWLLLS